MNTEETAIEAVVTQKDNAQDEQNSQNNQNDGMPVYRVFVKQGCSRCALVTRKLKEAGVDFTEMNIAQPEYMQLARQMMVSTAGQIIDMYGNKVTLDTVLRDNMMYKNTTENHGIQQAQPAVQSVPTMAQPGAVLQADGSWLNPDGTLVHA